MIESREFLIKLFEECITIEPSKNSDELIVTVPEKLVEKKVYESVEVRVKEYSNFVILENNTEEIMRIHSTGMLSKKDALNYAKYLQEKINSDIMNALKINVEQ